MTFSWRSNARPHCPASHPLDPDANLLQEFFRLLPLLYHVALASQEPQLLPACLARRWAALVPCDVSLLAGHLDAALAHLGLQERVFGDGTYIKMVRTADGAWLDFREPYRRRRGNRKNMRFFI
jgi:hypothetical protein